MIQTLKETGNDYQIPAKYDGAVYDIAIGQDCVCKDIGDEFAIDYNASSLNVSFNAGSQAIIGGNFFHVTSNETITLQANSVIYLTARIDDTQPNGQKGYFAQCTASSMQSDNLNGSGNVRDMLLYIVTTSASGVSNVVDMRNIKGQGQQAYGSYAIWVGSTTEEEQQTFDVPTISFTYDD